MAYANIVATGMYLPPIEVDNTTLKQRLEANYPNFVDKMEKNSAIKSRWQAETTMVTSDLAEKAGRAALQQAEITPEQVGMVIVATDSPDYITPATSVVTAYKLQAVNAGTFDVGCACASFPTGLAIAGGLLAVNPYLDNLLVIGAYLMQRLAAPDDPMVFFYGDGAGAALVRRCEQPGIITSAFLADGSYHSYWGIFAGGTVEPASVLAVEQGRTQVRMLEKYPPEVNHQGWPRLVRTLAQQGDFELEDIDLLIFTQVRLASIVVVMEDLGLPMTKTHYVMDKWGYTGSACIPMCLHDALSQGKAKQGDLVVLVGSGVGYNQAGVALVL